MIDSILLGFLMKRELSGYEIKQIIQQSTSNFYNASFGSIYPALKKLERGGFVTLREVVEGNKFKKLYSITKEGRQKFLEWLESPIPFARNNHTFLVKVFFMEYLEPSRARALLEDYIKKLEEEVNHLETIEPYVKEKATFYPHATLRYGKCYYQMTLEWCKELKDQIK